jgi:3-oxoacyl-[acyl-carrier protein] reductase
MKYNLENKVVIVTGGAAGIGLAAAKAFANESSKVIVWDMLPHFPDSESAFKPDYMRVDVSEFEQVKSAMDAVAKAYGKVDILINNAGITRDKSLLKMDPDTWQKVIDVNLTGVFNCGKCAAEHMANAGSGVIINTSSVVGLYGNFGQTNYVATKAGVIGMTKTWARELGRKGIRVNAVAPGFIATEMVQKMPPDVLDGMKAKTPIGKLGRPEDIANAYVFLASDAAAFITGTTLSVDGGLVA